MNVNDDMKNELICHHVLGEKWDLETSEGNAKVRSCVSKMIKRDDYVTNCPL